MSTSSQCPDCGATFRPGAATCPGCGMEWPDDPEAAAIEKLDEVIVKVQRAVESRFECNDQAISTDESGGGFLFTDPADGAQYELHISKFDPQAWADA